ncbi:MAG TPA: DNA polymerase III subunit gamma/tau [Chthoniobacterales bacterium]|nr:DNA polymerase III subunit gamma/tau [Chthoniobacterales bacterium]
MSYQVFARKYRPQTFDDLVGQEHVTRTLRNAVEQNRLAHAYLFVGPRGIGKTSTARILAKALNCIHGPTTTPCGVCDNCKEIAAGNSLDVLEIDGASNNGVEQVRELRDNVRYAPAKSRYKIYIIDEVHMLTSQAFNALLKTLEEPPEHVKFIFATTEPQKVLATILSRCQRFDLHRIPANLIAQHLQFIAGKEKITLEPAAAHAIARGADGGLRDAESMLDQLVAFCGETIAESDVLNVFGFTSEQTVVDFTTKILRGETSAALGLLDEQAAAGKEMMKLMSDLIAHLRDLLVYKVKPEAIADETAPELQSSLGEEAVLLETDRLLELIEQFAAAEGRMKWAPNKKLHFEVAVIKAIQTLSQVTLDQVISNLAALRGDDGASAPSVAKPAARPPERKAASKPAAAPSTPVAAPSPPASHVPQIERVWPKVVQLAYVRRPLIKTWIDSARLLGAEGGTVLLGFPPDQKTVMESLARPANRSFLEALLKEVSGSDWKVKLSLEEGLPPAAPAEDIEAESAATRPTPDDSIESFKNDPLIKEALELFKGEIKSVTTT